MSVNFLFYSTQGLVHDAVVFFVVVSDFANERNQHSETPTDQRNHNFSSHFIKTLAVADNLGRRLVLRIWLQWLHRLGAMMGRPSIQDRQCCLAD
jgi:hypothetical protein